MRLKAFIFTADALVALTAVFVLFGATIVLTSLHQANSPEMIFQNLGRDYLELKYLKGQSITESNFNSLTGLTISETEPVTPSSDVFKSTLYLPQQPCSACAASGISVSCTFVQSTCLNPGLNTQLVEKSVWVTQ